MFSITRKLVKINKVSGVSEFKGDGRDHGCSVKVTILLDNDILDVLCPGLRAAYYEKDSGKKKTAPDGQGEMSLPRQDLDLTSRRLLNVVTPIKFKNEMAGYALVYHRGATPESEISLTEVGLSNFSVEPHDGGSCETSFNMYQKPAAEVQGFIDHMEQTEIEITLIPPTEKQATLVPAKTTKKKTAAEKIAEEGDPLSGSDLAQDETRIDA